MIIPLGAGLSKPGPFFYGLVVSLLGCLFAVTTPVGRGLYADKNFATAAIADLDTARAITFRPQLVQSAATDAVSYTKFWDGVGRVCVRDAFARG